MAYFNHLC